jgi:hypothetical protein
MPACSRPEVTARPAAGSLAQSAHKDSAVTIVRAVVGVAAVAESIAVVPGLGEIPNPPDFPELPEE